MSHESQIIIAIATVAVLVLGVFLYAQKANEVNQEIAKNEEIIDQNATLNVDFNSQEENSVIPTEVEESVDTKEEVFVIDVDQNVDNWKIKETEFFVVRYPKEWQWLESNVEKTGYYSHVITNNPNFNINKYADIGIFSDIGTRSPLMLINDMEIVITSRGKSTSDSGTPQNSLNSIFEMAKANYPSVDCGIFNNKNLPFTAYCYATYGHQLQRSYYVINDKISLTLTVRTTKDNSVEEEIFNKMMKNIILK